MSSELYVQWSVEDLERMHLQLKHQLAEERSKQETRLNQILESLKKINGQINSIKTINVDNDASPVEYERMRNVSSFNTDALVSSGFDERIEEKKACSAEKKQRGTIAVDWSSYFSDADNTDLGRKKKVAYANSIGVQLDIILLQSKEALAACNSYAAYLNGLIDDSEVDFDFFKQLADARLQMLKNMYPYFDIQDFTPELREYYVLCAALNIIPTKIDKSNIDAENKRLFEKYVEKNQEDYVYRNLAEVFFELNMSIAKEVTLDGLEGQMVMDETIPGYSVFMSKDGNGIIFETIAEVEDGETLSMNKKVLIEEAAKKICKKHMAVIQKMKERGIDLSIVCEEKPTAEGVRKMARNNVGKTIQGKNLKTLVREKVYGILQSM